jgi:hypothetical protein
MSTSNSCPVETDPDWIALLAAFTPQRRGDAMAVVNLNGGKVPTPEEGFKIYDNLMSNEHDDRWTRSSWAFKLARAEKQLAETEALLVSERAELMTPAQKAAIGTLITSQKSLVHILTDAVAKTRLGVKVNNNISVSSLSGSSDYGGDLTKYEAFKNYGIFMHEIVEKAQLAVNSGTKDIMKTLDRPFFDKALAEFRAASPFQIEGLSDEELYEMARTIASVTMRYHSEGALILPEITTWARTHTNRLLIGRLDLMVIDRNGKVHILDFKTKKLQNLVHPLTKEITQAEAMRELGGRTTLINKVTDTAVDFQHTRRTTFDTWAVQLKMYENMLRKSGLDVGEQTIVGMLYQATRGDNPVFEGSNLVTMSASDFYARAANGADSYNFYATNIKVGLKEQGLMQMRRIVDKIIPLTEAQQQESEEAIRKSFPFDVTESQNKQLMGKINDRVQQDMQQLEEELSRAKREKSETKIALIETRITTLKNFLGVYNADTAHMGESLKMRFVTEYLENDIESIMTVARTASRTYGALRQGFDEHQGDNKKNIQRLLARYENTVRQEYAQQIEATLDLMDENQLRDTLENLIDHIRTEVGVIMNSAMSKAQAMQPVFAYVKSVVSMAIDDPDTDITKDSPLAAKLNEIGNAIEATQTYFREVGLDAAIKVIEFPGQETFEKVSEQMRQALEPELVMMREKLAKLEAGMPVGIRQRITGRIFALFSKEAREELERINASGDPEAARNLKAIEDLQKKILRHEYILRDGIAYTPEAITAYIEGVTDESSPIYIGQSDAWSSTFTMRLGQYEAGASSSERAIAAMVMLLKAGRTDATRNALDMNEELQLQQKLDAALAENGGNPEAMNDSLTETRTRTSVNRETGELESHEEYTFRKPMSVLYETTRNEYRFKIMQAIKRVSQAKERAFAASPANRKQIEDEELFPAIREREEISQEFITWQLTHSQLPMVEGFYTSQQLIPQQYRESIQRLTYEREALMQSVGGKYNDELLEDDARERIYEIQRLIAVEKQKAADENPAYQEFLENHEEGYYDYEHDDTAFLRVHAAKKREYINDPEALARWERENQVSVATDEWHEMVNEIYEEFAEIFPGNEQLERLIKQRSRIIKTYKRSGRLDTTLMTQEDANQLESLEGQIEILREMSRDPDAEMLESEREYVNELSNRLKALKVQELNPYYKEKLHEMTKVLNDKWNNLEMAKMMEQQARDSGDAAGVTRYQAEVQEKAQQFAIYEEIYKAWYNRNHENVYIPIRLDFDPEGQAQPRKFHLESLPAPHLREEYMKNVPTGKWSIRKIKDSARNPHYQETPDGVPLPKGLVRQADGSYTVEPGFVDTHGYINQAYRDMQAKPATFDLYNTMMQASFALQKKTTGSSLGYRVPGYAADMVENMLRAKHEPGTSMGEAMKNSWKTWFDENVRGKTSANDQVTNYYGDLGNRVRFRYNQQLPMEMQSKDAVNAWLKWASEAHYNIAMQEVQPVADNYIQHMKQLRKQLDTETNKNSKEMSKRLADMNKLIELLEYERNKFVSGKYEEDEDMRGFKKTMGTIFSFTSFARIGFDMANQTKNMIAGNLQAFLAADSSKSAHYSMSDYRWAKGQIYGKDGFIGNYISDWGKVSGLSKETMLYRIFNPSQKDLTKYLDNTANSKTRRLLTKMSSIQDLAYLLQDKGDTEISMTVWLAVMNAHRYEVIAGYDAAGQPIFEKDAQGNTVTVTAMEAYTKDPQTGRLIIKPSVNFDKKKEKMLQNVVYSEIRRAQGNYAKEDQTMSESNMFGKFIMFFRKYLVPTMLNRLGHVRPNWEGQEAQYGFMRATWDAFRIYGPQVTMKHLLLGGFTPQFIKNSPMNDLFARKVAHTSRDFIVSTAMIILGAMALGYVRGKDEEDEELNMVEGNLIRVLWGVQTEALSMNPLPVFGGADEYVRNFTSLTSLTREFQMVGKALTHTVGYAYAQSMGGEAPDPELDSLLYQLAHRSAFYQKKTGPFEAGDPKFYKDLYDFSGVKNIRDFFDPNDRIDLVKRRM